MPPPVTYHPCYLDVLGTTVGILTLLALVITGILLWRQIRLEHEWNRRRMAHELIFDSVFGKFREFRNRLENKINIYNENETYANKQNALSPEDLLALEAILNYFDNVCAATKNGTLDEDIVFGCLAAIIVAYARWAAPYIKENRKIDPRFWIDIDPYVESWKKRQADIEKRLLVPGKRKLG